MSKLIKYEPLGLLVGIQFIYRMKSNFFIWNSPALQGSWLYISFPLSADNTFSHSPKTMPLLPSWSHCLPKWIMLLWTLKFDSCFLSLFFVYANLNQHSKWHSDATFSLAQYSPSHCRTIPLKNLQHFPASWRSVCNPPPAPRLQPQFLSGLISTNSFMHLTLDAFTHFLIHRLATHFQLSIPLSPFLPLPDRPCPFRSQKNASMSFKRHFKHYLLCWTLPDLSQVRYSAQSTLSVNKLNICFTVL